MVNIVLSSPGIEKKPALDNRVETPESQSAYQAAQGIGQLAQALDGIMQRTEGLKAAADSAQIQTHLSGWLQKQENDGNTDNLAERFKGESDRLFSAAREKNASAYYGEEMERQSVGVFVSMIPNVEKTAVNGVYKKNADSLNKLISEKNTFIINNPSMYEFVADTVENSINSAVMPAAEKERMILKSRKGFAEASLNAFLNSDPAKVSELAKGSLYERDLSAPERQKYIEAAEKKTTNNSIDYHYNDLYRRFRTADGTFDYTAAVSFLRKPENQSEIGLSPEEANKVGDMLYSQFTQDKEMRESERSNTAASEIDSAVNTLYTGNGAQAVAMIQRSEAIKGNDKLTIINKMKDGTLGKEKDELKSFEIARQIARHEINTQEELLNLMSDGSIDSQTYSKMMTLMENRDKRGAAVMTKALDQVNSVYGKSIFGKLSPAEAASLNAMGQEITSIYGELVARGASAQEIASVLSPENIQNLGESFAASFDDIIKSRMNRMGFEAKSSKVKDYLKWRESITAKPLQTIEDFVKEKGL